MFQPTHTRRSTAPQPLAGDFIPLIGMLCLIVFECFGASTVLNLYHQFFLGLAFFMAGAAVLLVVYLVDKHDRRLAAPQPRRRAF